MPQPNAEKAQKFPALRKAARKTAIEPEQSQAMPESKPAQNPDTKPGQYSSPPPQPKKEDIFDSISASLKTWWDFIKQDWREYYKGLLKITVIQLLVGIGLLLILLLIGLAIFTGVMALNLAAYALPIGIACGILFIIALIIVATIASSINFTKILLTESRLFGTPFSIGASFNRIKGKVMRFIILNGVLWIIILIPAALIFCLPFLSYFFTDPKTATTISFVGFFFSYMLALLYYIVAVIVYNFLIQFWAYGFVVEGLGVRDSLKKSVWLVKANLFGVLVFDIVLLVIVWIASIPLSIVYFVVYMLFYFMSFVMLMSPFIGLILMALAFLLMIAVVMLVTPVIEMIHHPIRYLFWKKLKEAA